MADKIRAWILIETQSGAKYKYVRNLIFVNGDSAWNRTSYTYGDTAGDTFLVQTGDSYGYIKSDYDNLFSNYTSGDSTLLFPEDDGDSIHSAGDTYLLTRRNFDTTATDNEYGDSDIAPYTYMKLSTASIQGIYVIEERITNWINNSNVVIP